MVTRYRAWRRRHGEAGGYTIVEFALASLVFLLISFGTVDVGRAIFLYSELHTAARDAAREAKVSNANGYGFSNSTINHRIHYNKNLIDSTEKRRPGLGSASGMASCTGACQPGDLLTVDVELPFAAVLPGFLGMDSLTLHASATVKME